MSTIIAHCLGFVLKLENYNKELEAEKREDEKIEAKIRARRKEKNKARLHPTKEDGPSLKRRRTSN